MKLEKIPLGKNNFKLRNFENHRSKYFLYLLIFSTKLSHSVSHVCLMIIRGKIICIGESDYFSKCQISGFMCNNKSIKDLEDQYNAILNVQ